MISRYTLLFFLLPFTSALGQLANPNSLTVSIDGTSFTTQPRRIRIGNYWWVTANTVKPDKSLRLWLGRYDGRDVLEPGNYLVVDADNPDTRDNKRRIEDLGTYKGFAVIKYVEETKSPRMEYHVGKSQNGDGIVTVVASTDGLLTARFGGTLAGSYWKERASATVFGGMNRLVGKLEDKAITKASGYDSDIDPEGNGYKRLDKKDQVVLTNGTFTLQFKK